MLLFKGIYNIRLCPNFWATSGSLIIENEHPENEYPENERDEEVIQVETCRGWCSWGF